MGLNKKYSGYKSYDYLEKDIDYKAFKLAKEIDRVEPYLIPLTTSEEERVRRIVGENPVISLHEHPQVFPEDMNEAFDYARHGRQVTAFEALSQSCLDCVFENLMDGMCAITSKIGWKWNDVLYDLGMRLCDIAHQDFVIIATRVDDILRAQREGKVALVLCIEGAMPIENELDRIDILYGYGVRLMGLVYSESNALGTGLKEERDGGLTYFGRLCVERMNKLGMAVDTAHCSDQTTLDAVETSQKPILATHAGARSLFNVKRLKPDNVIRAIANKGGLIGIEAAPHTTLSKQQPEHNIESVMEHFEYTKNLTGIDHITFGPDTLYGDHVDLHHVFRAALSIKQAFAGETIEEVPYVKGLENPTEASWNIVRWLVKHGYSDADIAKVIGGNAIRVLREIWY
ncbi:dipeptidase [Chloroflexota bacterium]